MTNLVRRYYLTRQLVEQQIKRKELLEKFCIALKHPMLSQHKTSTGKIFLEDAEKINITIEILERQLAEAGGGFK